jgi:hypothetical protein
MTIVGIWAGIGMVADVDSFSGVLVIVICGVPVLIITVGGVALFPLGTTTEPVHPESRMIITSNIWEERVFNITKFSYTF